MECKKKNNQADGGLLHLYTNLRMQTMRSQLRQVAKSKILITLERKTDKLIADESQILSSK